MYGAKMRCDKCNQYKPDRCTCKEPVFPNVRFPTTIAYDPVLKRPGCAIIAAGMGADKAVANMFNVDLWLTAPTDHMQVLPVEDAWFLDKVIKVTEAEFRKRGGK